MNKKGTTMVEAAMIFPLIVLVVAGIIYILIFLYNQTEAQAKMHMVLRKEAGKITETVEYLVKTEGSFPVYKREKQMWYKGELAFAGTGLLKGKQKSISGSCHIVTEKNFVRYADLLQ